MRGKSVVNHKVQCKQQAAPAQVSDGTRTVHDSYTRQCGHATRILCGCEAVAIADSLAGLNRVELLGGASIGGRQLTHLAVMKETRMAFLKKFEMSLREPHKIEC